MKNRNNKLVIEKTLKFLNDVRFQLEISPRIEKISSIATTHETSHASFTSACRLGYFTKTGIKTYTCSVDLFKEEHAVAVLDMNRSYYSDKKKEKEMFKMEKAPVQKSLLENIDEDWKTNIFDRDHHIWVDFAQLTNDQFINEVLLECKRRNIVGEFDIEVTQKSKYKL